MDAWTFGGPDIREAIMGTRLLNPSIDLSNDCNLNCPYCYVEKIGSLHKKRSENELELSDYRLLIDKLAAAGARTINIIGAGEPTIDPNFRTVAKYIRDAGIKVLVATNGISIARDNSVLHFLHEIEASVVLKVNSFVKGLQDDLVGHKGYAGLRNIALNKLIGCGFNKGKPTRLGINTLLMKSNLSQVMDMLKFCRENNVTLICGNYMPTGRTEASVFQGEYLLENDRQKCLFEPISPEEYRTLRKNVIAYDEENGFPTVSPDAYVSGLPCIQGLGIQIDNEGRAWHCPARSQVIDGQIVPSEVCSSIKGMDLARLWKENGYLKEFRSGYNGLCPYKTI